MNVKSDIYYARNPKFGESNCKGVDMHNEKRVEHILSKKWNVIFHKYSHYDNIDWWIEKDRKTVAVAELKTAFAHKGYAYLNLRKYLNLKWASDFLNIPALIIFQFKTGEIYWENVNKLEGQTVILGSKIMKSNNDIEPGVSIPVENLKKIKGD